MCGWVKISRHLREIPLVLLPKQGIWVFSCLLPSLSSTLSKPGASVEHTAAEAMGEMDLGAGGVLLFLGAMPGSWLRSAHCKEESVNMSCHINVHIFGWLQMRSQGVSGCFGNQPLQLVGPVADRSDVLAGANHLPCAQGLHKLLCGEWWAG